MFPVGASQVRVPRAAPPGSPTWSPFSLLDSVLVEFAEMETSLCCGSLVSSSRAASSLPRTRPHPVPLPTGPAADSLSLDEESLARCTFLSGRVKFWWTSSPPRAKEGKAPRPVSPCVPLCALSACGFLPGPSALFSFSVRLGHKRAVLHKRQDFLYLQWRKIVIELLIKSGLPIKFY